MSKTIFSLDSQLLNEIQLCARKTKFSFIDNLTVPYKGKSLENGSVIHEMLRAFNRAKLEKLEYLECIKLGIEAGRLSSIETKLDNDDIEWTIETFEQYCEYNKYDRRETVAIETPFSKTLYEDDSLHIIYEGKIDHVIKIPELGDELIPIDYKSSLKNVEPSNLSNQFFGYAWALNSSRLIVSKIGFQKTLEPKDKFREYTLNYPDELMQDWVESTIFTVRQFLLYNNVNYYPPNYTSCDKYSGCYFKSLCATPEKNRAYKMERDYIRKEEWDPAKDLENRKIG